MTPHQEKNTIGYTKGRLKESKCVSDQNFYFSVRSSCYWLPDWAGAWLLRHQIRDRHQYQYQPSPQPSGQTLLTSKFKIIFINLVWNPSASNKHSIYRYRILGLAEQFKALWLSQCEPSGLQGALQVLTNLINALIPTTKGMPPAV